MTFVNDDGEALDFDGTVAITRRAVSFFNSKIQGDFSVNFNVDNNSVNRRVLGYDGPQMLNQVAFTRQSFTLMRNGNPFMKGVIVIQQDNGSRLSCFFLGGNANWFNLLQGLITELDYSGVTNAVNYEIQLDATRIDSRLHSTSGIVFPLVDWCFGFNKGDDNWVSQGQWMIDISGDVFIASIGDYYPCFYLHTLVDEIVKQSGLKITGNILSDAIYTKFILTPVTAEIKRPDVKITTAYGANFSTSSGAVEKYNQFTAGSNPDSLFSTADDQYTADRNCIIIMSIIIASSIVPGGSNLIVTGAQNGTPGISGSTYTTAVAVSNIVVRFPVYCAKGDILSVYVQRTGAAGTVQCTLNAKFDIPSLITDLDFVTPDLFLPKLRSVEILKFIVNFFGCSVSFDEFSKTLTMNIIQNVKVEDADDWSAYYQSHYVDYTINAAANNYQRLLEPKDPTLDAYNKKHTKKYGEGDIQTGNTLKEISDLLSIPFAASDFGFGKNQVWSSSVPLAKLTDATDPILFQSITNDGGRNGYNFSSDYQFRASQLVRIVDDLQGDIGIYPAFSDSAAGVVSFREILYTAITSTGKLYPQKIVYNTIPPRILINKPETLVSYFAKDSVNLLGDSRSFAHFTKPTTGLNIDGYKANAAFDNPDGDFNDPTINELYFPKISRLIGNPMISAFFLLPESVFQSFDFQRFIYLKTKDLTGYFWVDSIINYQDGQTPVQVKLLML